MSTQPKFTQLPQAFDASGIAPSQPFEALPLGWYNVNITDGDIAPLENNGLRMNLEFTVLDGPFKGRKVFDGFNYQHSSAKAQEIAQQHLSAISHATGVIRYSDVQELFGKPFQMQVNVEPGRWVDGNNQEIPVPPGTPAGQPPVGAVKWYDPKNRFRGAKAGTGAAAAAPAGAPGWAAKAPGAAAGAPPVSAPWMTPGAATPPATPPPATPPPVAAPPAAPAAAPAPKGPKAPKKAEPARTFFVLLPDGTVKQPAIPEAEVVKMLAQGMPPETLINPGVEDDGWKPAASFGLGAPATPPPAAAPAATPPAAATAAGAPVTPPWLR